MHEAGRSHTWLPGCSKHLLLLLLSQGVTVSPVQHHACIAGLAGTEHATHCDTWLLQLQLAVAVAASRCQHYAAAVAHAAAAARSDWHVHCRSAAAACHPNHSWQQHLLLLLLIKARPASSTHHQLLLRRCAVHASSGRAAAHAWCCRLV
jgi:hypothetical protein